MTTKCVVTILLSVIVSTFAAEPTREELIQNLIQKGDQVAKTDTRAAFWAYTNARVYEPENKDVAERLTVTKPELGRIEAQDDINRTASAARFLPLPVYANWPKQSAQHEISELRMLLDPRVTGTDWRCKRIVGKDATLYMFLKKPEIGFDEMRKTYGAPTSETKYPSESNAGEWVVWTYSRWRVLGKDNEIHYIVWAPPAGDAVLR